MKFTERFCAMLFIYALSLGYTSAVRGGDDEADIRAVIEQRRVAWNTEDIDGYRRLLTEDADILSATGRSAYGREELIKLYADQRKTAYRSANISATQVVRIKFARPDVALVDAEAELIGIHGADGNVLPSIKGQVLFLVVKDNERWLISSIRGVTRIPTQPTR